MIRKSVQRFSEKIMRKQSNRASTHGQMLANFKRAQDFLIAAKTLRLSV
jgi:hypothetical protein